MSSSLSVCAHRGASGTSPENTLVAFREAVRLGVHMIEFDVNQTGDGQSVIIHDDSVDRTTDGRGQIASLTLREIKAFDAGSWFDQRYAGERIPTLAEALAIMPDDTMLNVHVKPNTPDMETLIADVVAQLRAQRTPDNAFIASHQHVIEQARAIAPEWPTCNLSGQTEGDYVALSHALGCRFIQPLVGIVTQEMVQTAHALGIKVNIFYADDEAEMQLLIDMGVDGILTNYPAKLLRLLGRGLPSI